jgi:hypothetical protein
MRETCASDGTWNETGFVCARTVAVDDQTGGFCVTKGDGSYRCSGGNVTLPLPSDTYVRVQASQTGLVGLNAAGQLAAPEMLVVPNLPEALTFRATQMGSTQAICPLFRDGTFGMSRDVEMGANAPSAMFQSVPGTFSRAFCYWEGFTAGVLTDGSLLPVWDSQPPAGNDWIDVAASDFIFCGLRASGTIACMPPPASCGSVNADVCVGSSLPSFPGSSYRSVTATAAAACAIDTNGALTCQRYDGTPMLADPGPYTFAEGGQSVLCTIRVDGSAACFQHAGDSASAVADPGVFMPINLPFGPDW